MPKPPHQTGKSGQIGRIPAVAGRVPRSGVRIGQVEMVLADAVFLVDQRHAVPDMRGDRIIACVFERAASFLQKRIYSQGIHLCLRIG